MKTNITVTVIIACVAMIVLSGIVTGMNTMSNVSSTFDLTAYDPRTPGFTLGTTPTIPTPYSIEGTAMYEAAEVVEPKKISDKSISIWETGTKNIATQYFESMYNPSVVSPFSFEGMTGIAPERKEPTEPTEPVELEFISPTGYVEDINPITGLRRTTGTAIRTTPEGTGLFASLGSADFSGITEPEPDTKKNFEEASIVLETAHEDIYEMSEVGGSFGNTLHTNDTELINEIFKQLDESALSTIGGIIPSSDEGLPPWEVSSLGSIIDPDYITPDYITPEPEKTVSQQAGGFIRGGLIEAVKLSVIGTGGGMDFVSSILGIDLGFEACAREGTEDWFAPKTETVAATSKKAGVMNVIGSSSTVITEAVAGGGSSIYTGGFNAAGGYKAKKLEAVFNKFDKLWERARPSPELQRALDLSSDAGFIPTTGGAWAEQQRELTEAKKLEKLEDYLKVGLSVSLPNMQDVKLNPKL